MGIYVADSGSEIRTAAGAAVGRALYEHSQFFWNRKKVSRCTYTAATMGASIVRKVAFMLTNGRRKGCRSSEFLR